VSGSAAQRGKAGGQGRPAEGDDVLARQFETAEKHSTATLAGWVGHPAVRGVIERHRNEANTTVARSAGTSPARRRPPRSAGGSTVLRESVLTGSPAAETLPGP